MDEFSFQQDVKDSYATAGNEYEEEAAQENTSAAYVEEENEGSHSLFTGVNDEDILKEFHQDQTEDDNDDTGKCFFPFAEARSFSSENIKESRLQTSPSDGHASLVSSYLHSIEFIS